MVLPWNKTWQESLLSFLGLKWNFKRLSYEYAEGLSASEFKNLLLILGTRFTENKAKISEIMSDLVIQLKKNCVGFERSKITKFHREQPLVDIQELLAPQDSTVRRNLGQ